MCVAVSSEQVALSEFNSPIVKPSGDLSQSRKEVIGTVMISFGQSSLHKRILGSDFFKHNL